MNPRRRRPRPTIAIADRFGLPSSETWVAIPMTVRLLLRDKRVLPAHQLVLYEILDRWRPDSGNSVSLSLSAISLVTGQTRGNVQFAIMALADASLIAFEAVPGRCRLIHLDPLLQAISPLKSPSAAPPIAPRVRPPKQPGSTVQPAVQDCTAPCPDVYSPLHTTVQPAAGTVQRPGSHVSPQSQRNHKDALACAQSDTKSGIAASAAGPRVDASEKAENGQLEVLGEPGATSSSTTTSTTEAATAARKAIDEAFRVLGRRTAAGRVRDHARDDVPF